MLLLRLHGLHGPPVGVVVGVVGGIRGWEVWETLTRIFTQELSGVVVVMRGCSAGMAMAAGVVLGG